MATALVHIGRSKTASTAIQDLLRDNVESLSEQGVRVPTFLGGANHSELAIAYATRHGRVAKSKGVTTDSDVKRLRRRLDERLSRNVEPNDFWVVSSEHLSSLLVSELEVRDLTDRLRIHFDRVVYVAWVRRPDYFLPSAYSQAVKSHAKMPLNARFVRHRRRQLDHEEFAERWSGSAQEFTMLPYLENWASGDRSAVYRQLLAQISAASGPEISLDTLELPGEGGANRRLSAQAAEFLRLLNVRNDFGEPPLDPRPRRAVIRALEDMPGDPLRITPAAYEELLDLNLCNGRLTKPSRSHSEEWEQWFSQPRPVLGESASLSEEQYELIRQRLLTSGIDVDRLGWIDRLPKSLARPVWKFFIQRRGDR